MSRRHSVMRSPLTRTAQILACFATVLALVGCGAGLVTQTNTQVAAVDGVSANLGDIALRDVLIPYPTGREGGYPPGSNVPLHLTIVNQGVRPDILVSVTAPAARQVLLAGTTTVPPGFSVTTPRGPDAGTGAGTASPRLSAAPISPLNVGSLRIVLVDTTRPLRAGQNIEVTFVFQGAGAVTLLVPMGPADSARSPLGTGVGAGR